MRDDFGNGVEVVDIVMADKEMIDAADAGVFEEGIYDGVAGVRAGE